MMINPAICGSAWPRRGAIVPPRLWPSTKIRFGSIMSAFAAAPRRRRASSIASSRTGSAILPAAINSRPSFAAYSLGPFFVAQDLTIPSAAKPQARSRKWFECTDSFVPIIRSGAMHQHHRRPGSGPHRDGDGAGQAPFTIAYGECFFTKGIGPGQRRRSARICPGRYWEERTGLRPLSLGIEHDFDDQTGVLEFAGDEPRDIVSAELERSGLSSTFEMAGLFLHCLPGFA